MITDLYKLKPDISMLRRLRGEWRQDRSYRRCIGHWIFHEGGGALVYDVSGYRAHGSIGGSATFGTSRYGRALLLNGTSGYVSLGTAPHFANAEPLTLSAFIRPVSLGEASSGRLIEKQNAFGTGWNWWIEGTNQLRFIGRFSVAFADRISSTNAVSLGTWQHVAVTWDGTTTATGIRFYVNGIETGYATTTNGSGTNDDDSSVPLTIGNDLTDARTFDGLMDHMRIDNRVLPLDRIKELARHPYLSFYRAYAKRTRSYYFVFPPVTIEGTLSKALGILTVTATGELDLSAAAAITLDALTLAATGQTGTSGELDATLDDLTLAGTGALEIEGAAAPTLDDATVAGTGVLDLAASANITLDDLTSSATATLALVGNVAATLDAVTLLAAGVSEDRTGTLDVTLGDLTLSAYETIPEGGDGLDNILNITNNYGTLR